MTPARDINSRPEDAATIDVFAYRGLDCCYAGIHNHQVSQAHAEVLRASGHHAAVLWVAEANVRARRFYERAGWSGDGAIKTETAFGPPVAEMRYRTRILPMTVFL